MYLYPWLVYIFTVENPVLLIANGWIIWHAWVLKHASSSTCLDRNIIAPRTQYYIHVHTCIHLHVCIYVPASLNCLHLTMENGRQLAAGCLFSSQYCCGAIFCCRTVAEQHAPVTMIKRHYLDVEPKRMKKKRFLACTTLIIKNSRPSSILIWETLFQSLLCAPCRVTPPCCAHHFGPPLAKLSQGGSY